MSEYRIMLVAHTTIERRLRRYPEQGILMGKVIALSILAMASLVFGGCTSARHGSFVPMTYAPSTHQASAEFIGMVEGESAQTFLLYILPLGDPASTEEAVKKAKSQLDGTVFLSDVSIDDRTYWGFGYATQIIRVSARAYR